MDKMTLQRPTDPAEESSQKQQNGSDTDSLSTSKKRPREGQEDDGAVLSPEVLAKMSRSERKRHREKKRRSDVNKGFDDLTALLLEIDPVVRAEAEDRAKRGQWKSTAGGQEDNILSRVELIGRTVEVLRRVHKENEQRKLIIEQLLQRPANTSTNTTFMPLTNPTGSGMHGFNSGGTQQQLSGMRFPPRRPDQSAAIPQGASLAPLYQHQVGGTTISAYPASELLAFTNPQLQSLSGLVAAQRAQQAQQAGTTSASLFQQLASNRESAAAAALARARQNFQDERRTAESRDR